MEQDDNKKPSTGLFRSSTADLKGRQSVRATFRLSEAAIDAIAILATQLGIKQKSLFDHLAEDIRTLEQVARSFSDSGFRLGRRVQKTFVMSRRSLVSLEQIATSFDTPRDALVEFSIQRLAPLIQREKEKHEKRKALFQKVRAHLKRERELLREAQEELGGDDPLIDWLVPALAAQETAARHIEAFLEKSRIIESFDLEDILKARGSAGENEDGE